MTILEQLAARHSSDTFVPECLCGSAGSRRFDAWALVSTWSPMTTIGYEVKVSRSDFVRDTKWPEYLPYCHLFYWVCPPKVIAVNEVPEGCGLIYAGARLLTKVKAPRRESDPKCLTEIMTHVLMCRARVAPGFRAGYIEPESGADYWRRWLAEKREHADLGRAVGVALHAEVRRAQQEAMEAQAEAKGYEAFKEALRAAGMNPDHPSQWSARREVQRYVHGDDRLRRLAESARRLSAELDEVAGDAHV